MQTENVLIARVCHDLITPCNAINLGIEAYEMSEDRSLLSSIKDSASKANTILKFVRELFLSKDDDFLYSVNFLKNLISEYLEIYNIGCNFVTDETDLSCLLGKVVLYNGAVMKELMPMGGRVMFNVGKDYANIVYTGNNILEIDTLIPEELSYRNIIRFKLLELLKISGFSINSSMEKGEGKIVETLNK